MNAWFDANSNMVRIEGLRNTATGAYVNAGGGVSVTADVVARGTTTVLAGPITLTHVSGSNGDWQGTFPASTSIALETPITIRVTADGGASLKAIWAVHTTVQERRP